MTKDEEATELEAALRAAERALEGVTTKMKVFTHDHPGMSPFVRRMFIRESQGIEGALQRLHFDVTPFDTRPQTRDGGAKP